MKPSAVVTLLSGAVMGAGVVVLPQLWSGDVHAAESEASSPFHGLFDGLADARAESADVAPPAPAQPLTYDPRVSLAPLVDRLGPAVVGITVSREVAAGGMDLRDVPAPFREFFGIPDGYESPERDRKRVRTGQGSGFLISEDGYVLTNNHVVDDADTVTVQLADEREFEARVVGTDPGTDVALVKIDDVDDLPTVQLGSSEALRVGDWAVAIGNPFGLEHTVTAGIISGKGRVIGAGPYDQFLQTDASINPGNSGGPLFNLDGEVIGINTAIVGQGIGFSVPIDMVKGMLDDLKQDGAVARGWIGVGLRDLDGELAGRLGLEEDTVGVVFTQVYPGTPAAKAGVKPGDVLVTLDGEPVDETTAVVRAIGSHRPGEKVSMGLLRDGKRKTLRVELGRRPDEGALRSGTWSGPEASPDSDGVDPGAALGVSLADPSSMGLRGKDGLVVVQVDRGGPSADRLRAGDRIIEATGRSVRDQADLAAALAEAEGAVLLVVERRGAQVLVDVPLE